MERCVAIERLATVGDRVTERRGARRLRRRAETAWDTLARWSGTTRLYGRRKREIGVEPCRSGMTSEDLCVDCFIRLRQSAMRWNTTAQRLQRTCETRSVQPRVESTVAVVPAIATSRPTLSAIGGPIERIPDTPSGTAGRPCERCPRSRNERLPVTLTAPLTCRSRAVGASTCGDRYVRQSGRSDRSTSPSADVSCSASPSRTKRNDSFRKNLVTVSCMPPSQAFAVECQ